jgi:hypothetical protein
LEHFRPEKCDQKNVNSDHVVGEKKRNNNRLASLQCSGLVKQGDKIRQIFAEWAIDYFG